jgi:hypothetical protein
LDHPSLCKLAKLENRVARTENRRISPEQNYSNSKPFFSIMQELDNAKGSSSVMKKLPTTFALFDSCMHGGGIRQASLGAIKLCFHSCFGLQKTAGVCCTELKGCVTVSDPISSVCFAKLAYFKEILMYYSSSRKSSTFCRHNRGASMGTA